MSLNVHLKEEGGGKAQTSHTSEMVCPIPPPTGLSEALMGGSKKRDITNIS